MGSKSRSNTLACRGLSKSPKQIAGRRCKCSGFCTKTHERTFGDLHSLHLFAPRANPRANPLQPLNLYQTTSVGESEAMVSFSTTIAGTANNPIATNTHNATSGPPQNSALAILSPSH